MDVIFRTTVDPHHKVLCGHTCTSVHTVLQSGFNDASQERCSCVWFTVRAGWSLNLPSRVAAFFTHSEEFKSHCINLCRWPVGLYDCVSPGHLYTRCNWLQLPSDIAGEKWCLSVDEYLFTRSVCLKCTFYKYCGLHRTNFRCLRDWRSRRSQRFVWFLWSFLFSSVHC